MLSQLTWSYSQPYNVNVVRRWLGFAEEDIPTEAQVLSRIQQPHITQHLFANGLAHYAMPITRLEPDRPHLINVDIENTVTKIALHSHEEVPFNIMGNNILQAHFCLTISPHMFIGNIRYDLIISTGREVTPSPLLYDRDSWGRTIQPPSLSVLAYNASGVAAAPVSDYISSITNWYRPHLVFITDTRVPSTQARDFANLLHYNMVTTMDSIRGAGGVWILSRSNHTFVQLIAETETQIRFNMQPTMPGQIG